MSALDEVKRARREMEHDDEQARHHLDRAERDLRFFPTTDSEAARRDVREARYALDDRHYDDADWRLGRAERRLR